MPSAFRKAGSTSFFFLLINTAKIRKVHEKYVLKHINLRFPPRIVVKIMLLLSVYSKKECVYVLLRLRRGLMLRTVMMSDCESLFVSQ